MKTCKKCGETKALTEFTKAPTNLDGVKGQCKSCDSAYSKLHYEINRERRLVQSRANYEANKETKKVQQKEWAAKNRKVVNTHQRKRWKDNKDNLKDDYVKRLIMSCSDIKYKDITPEMVEEKRLQVIIKRTLSNKQIPDSLTKCCTICNQTKPINAFKKDAVIKGGRVNQCRNCLNARQNARRWAINPPKFREVLPDGHKRCTKCEEVKPVDKFHYSIRGYLSRTSYCSACMNVQAKEWKQNNPEKVREYKRKDAINNADRIKKYRVAYHSSPNRKELDKQYRQRYYQLNIEKIKLRSKEWVLNNPEKVREKRRKYEQLNKEWLLAADKRYRDALADGYVKALLFKGMTSKIDIPQSLIEAKRLQVLLKRRSKDENSNNIT